MNIKNVPTFDGGYIEADDMLQTQARLIIRVWSMNFAFKGNNLELGLDDVLILASFADVRQRAIVVRCLYVLVHWDYIRDYRYGDNVRFRLTMKAIQLIRGAKK